MTSPRMRWSKGILAYVCRHRELDASREPEEETVWPGKTHSHGTRLKCYPPFFGGHVTCFLGLSRGSGRRTGSKGITETVRFA